MKADREKKSGNPLLRELTPYRKYLIIGPVFKLLEAVLELLIPTLMVYVIDRGVMAGDRSYVLSMGGVMLAIAIVGFCSALVCQYVASVTSQGFGTKVRDQLFRHILTLSEKETGRIETVSLTNRLTADVNVLQQAVAMLIRLAIRAPFICAGSLVMAMILNLKLSLVIVCILPLLIVCIWLIMKVTVPLYRLVQKRLDAISMISGENLSGVRVIRAFAKTEEERSRFDWECDAYTEASVRVSRISALLSPVTSLVMNLAILAVLWFGGIQIQTGDMTSGEIIAFVNYISYMVTALLVTANLITLFTKAWASYGRVLEIFEMEPSIRGGAVTAEISPDAPAVEFRHVTMRYSDDPEILPSVKDISFTLKKGQILGIIGVTGSGKSSLIQLIPRFYDVIEGEVLVGGVNVKEWRLENLRRYVSVAQQHAVLVSGTIAENIAYGKPDATEEEIAEAAGIAQAAEFIEARPGRYQSIVERGGANFSGGQKQRLSIARAVIGKPSVLILDDSLSALDAATDAALRRALSESGIDSMIIVSQRAGNLRDADQILVLDDGICVGLGAHEELMRSCSVYQKIVQLSSAAKEER